MLRFLVLMQRLRKCVIFHIRHKKRQLLNEQCDSCKQSHEPDTPKLNCWMHSLLLQRTSSIVLHCMWATAYKCMYGVGKCEVIFVRECPPIERFNELRPVHSRDRPN